MKGRLDVRTITACAVVTALLIAVHDVLGFVPGVELVTVLLLSFCFSYGAGAGMITATAFSLLRCFVWGFDPKVIVQYLIYFNLFALLFGLLGRREKPIAVWICPVLLVLMAAGSAAAAMVGLPVSVLYQTRVNVMLWLLFGVMSALLVLYIVLLCVGGKGARFGRETASLAALAAFCTVWFTLLDDVLTPLWYGYTLDAAIAYFYTGFLAMLPQTVCAAVSVAVLFPVLKRIFGRAGKRPPSNIGRTDKDMV